MPLKSRAASYRLASPPPLPPLFLRRTSAYNRGVRTRDGDYYCWRRRQRRHWLGYYYYTRPLLLLGPVARERERETRAPRSLDAARVRVWSCAAARPPRATAAPRTCPKTSPLSTSSSRIYPRLCATDALYTPAGESELSSYYTRMTPGKSKREDSRNERAAEFFARVRCGAYIPRVIDGDRINI